jgi:hypothetical protein
LTNKSILATIRGQDVSAETARRGQDLVYAATTRGQTLNYNATVRGQDINREIAYDRMLTDYKLGKYTADLRADVDRLGQLRQLEAAYLKSETDLIVARTRAGTDLIKTIFGGVFKSGK